MTGRAGNRAAAHGGLAGRAALAIALALAALAPLTALADESEPGEVVARPRLPAGYMLVEGDIARRISEVGRPNPGRYATFQADKRWPGGVVPYAYDPNVSGMQARVDSIQVALAKVAATFYGSTIQFVPRTNESDYLYYIADAGSNFSPVGRQGGKQEIHIVSWGEPLVICHETMHSLGYWHEQSRPDRDTYVTIHTENLCTNCCDGGSCAHNYDKENGSTTYGPYDFDSIMHYGKCSFLSPSLFCTPNNYTIVVNQPWTSAWQDGIGQRSHLSRMDRVTLSFLYALSDWRFVGLNGREGASGLFLDPYPSLDLGISQTPSSGDLFIEPGTYLVAFNNTLSTPMQLHAPIGPVTIRRGLSVANAAATR